MLPSGQFVASWETVGRRIMSAYDVRNFQIVDAPKWMADTRLPYAVGISSSVTVFRGTPRVVWRTTAPRGRPRKHPDLAPGVIAESVAAVAERSFAAATFA